MVFFGDLGEGAKLFGGSPPRNDDRRSTSFSGKKYGYAPNTLVCTHGKVITKKNGMSTTVQCAVLTSLNPYLPRCACRVLWAT